jgi:hypothetical protein
LVPVLLAHVLAHEIAHTLAVSDMHSSTGIMKARWDARDLAEMKGKSLSFTEPDIRMIQDGLDARGATGHCSRKGGED